MILPNGLVGLPGLLKESGENGEPKLVYLVYLVYLVCLVGRTGNPTRGTKETRETRQTRSSAWTERVSGSGKKRKTTHMASLRSTKQPAHSAYFPAERNTSTVRRCRKRRPIFFIPSRQESPPPRSVDVYTSQCTTQRLSNLRFSWDIAVRMMVGV
jgi:hypothetical protein